MSANKQGWTPLTGMIGSGNVKITCLKCGHKFAPGWDKAAMETPQMQKKAKVHKRNLIIFFAFIIAALIFGFYFYN